MATAHESLASRLTFVVTRRSRLKVAPMTDLAGKTFIITGANTGIGKITALELAKRGAHVVLACRSKSKTDPVIDEIKKVSGNDKVEFIQLDLADLASVRECAKQILDRKIPIHGLINN